MKENELKEFLSSGFDGFEVHLDPAGERADIVLNRPPLNVIEMNQRDELRSVFEALDELSDVRVIVLRGVGEHFSSGGNIRGFLEASPEHVSKLADNVAAPARSHCIGNNPLCIARAEVGANTRFGWFGPATKNHRHHPHQGHGNACQANQRLPGS